MRWLSLLFLSFGGFLCVNLCWLTHSQRFEASKMDSPFSFEKRWEVAAPSYQEHLNQNYSYLGHGKQALVFASVDGRYVLKFFPNSRKRSDHWMTSGENWIKYCTPLSIYQWLAYRRDLKVLFDRYTMAFKELREETGLIAIHFNRTEGQFLPFTLVDRQGNRHTLSLDEMPFVVQHRAQLVGERLQETFAKEGSAGVVRETAALKALFTSRAKKGFTDPRQVFKKNYGFVGEKAIQLDVGKIRKASEVEENPEEEISKISKRLNAWVERRYPQSAEI